MVISKWNGLLSIDFSTTATHGYGLVLILFEMHSLRSRMLVQTASPAWTKRLCGAYHRRIRDDEARLLECIQGEETKKIRVDRILSMVGFCARRKSMVRAHSSRRPY